jgi:hypothetical protein
VIPVLLIVALAAATLLGGILGYSLGDGTFFSFGIGVGVVLVAMKLLSPYSEPLKKFLNNLFTK